MDDNIILKLPKYLDHSQFDEFLARWNQLCVSMQDDFRDVIFDLSGTEFISTLGVLLIAHISDNFIEDFRGF